MSDLSQDQTGKEAEESHARVEAVIEKLNRKGCQPHETVNVYSDWSSKYEQVRLDLLSRCSA